ncbi:MAG TPA: serine/threonine-protein kinase [Actinomycetota bacterium]
MTLAHIGRFQVERALGSGSYATVWLARDEDLEAWVAIKLLAENWSMNADARRRFMEEGRALRRLDSDRIVRVYEVGHLTDGRPYMVMEFADHGTLEDRLRLRGQLDQPFSVEEAIGLSLEIAECLTAVHDLRIVHRDVKPSNVLFRSVPRERQEALRRDGKPVATERTLLGDFGIARRLEGLPAHTMVVGSPHYMAPEQADPARAATVDYRSDVYSAAVILYETLTGRVPFGVESPIDLTRLEHEAPPVEAFRPDVPRALAEVLAQGLDRDPSKRFTSSWEWKEALRQSQGGTLEPAFVSMGTTDREGVLIDLRPGHAAPEVGTVPIPIGAAAGAAPTMATETMKRTAALPEAPAIGEGSPPRTIGQFPRSTGDVSTLNVRVPGGMICAAGLLMLVSIFLPWGSVGSGLESHVGAEFRSGALVAIEGVAQFLAGLRLWRTRRRWVASLFAGGASLVGIAGVGFASYELIRLGDPSNAPGLLLLLGSNLVTAFAGYRAQERLARIKRQERYPKPRTV